MGLNLATVIASLAFITVAVSLRPLSLNSKCEDLHVDLCKGLDYNQTFFPNSLNHLNQVEANSYLSQFSLLIQSGCYEDIKLFLCSIFIPVCTTHNEPILPCRRFCKRAKRGRFDTRLRVLIILASNINFVLKRGFCNAI